MSFIEQLCESITSDSQFSAEYEAIVHQSIQSGAGFGETPALEEEVLRRLVQSAAIFAQSGQSRWRQLAYRIGVASLAYRETLSGIEEASRLILARLGNYPAINFAFHGSPVPRTLTESIFYEIVGRQVDNTVRIGQRDAVFTDMQRTVWEALVSGSSLALSAPTSAGKSFVFLAYIEQLKRTRPDTNLVYIVPSRALISQVASDLREANTDKVFDVTTDTAIPIYNSHDRLVYLSWRLGMNSQSLVYARGPAACEDIAFKIRGLWEDPAISEFTSPVVPKGESLQVRKELAAFAKESVHPSYILAETVAGGVGFHYGRIPPLLRNAVESAFADGHLDYIVCTSTLLQGVNLPARNIFMQNPHKGVDHPIDPVDFWNLAGRAGRLGKDFQGNVFLVDYEGWESSPLSGPKDEPITPSLEVTLTDGAAELLEYIAETDRPSGETPHLEAAFSKLLRDLRQGQLSNTLDRVVGLAPQTRASLVAALEKADLHILLDADTLEASPQISGFRQQQLYDYMIQRIAKKGPDYLIPVHPSAEWKEALDKLRPVFARVHKYLELRSGKHHLYWAPLALRWMRGEPLPVIIDGAIRYHQSQGKKRSSRTVIREVLSDIESELRFKYVNLLGCYGAVLKKALIASGHASYAKKIPALTLYLELGAASQTMIQFISLGLSRHTANVIAGLVVNKDLDMAGAKRVLTNLNPEALGLSAYVASELKRVLETV